MSGPIERTTIDAGSAAAFRAPVWTLISAAWLVPAVLAMVDEYMQARLDAAPAPGLGELAWRGGDWLIYGALTPIVFLIARRLPLRRGVLARHVTLHFLISLVFCAAWAGAGVLLRRLLVAGPAGAATMSFMVSWFFVTLPYGVAVYFSVLGIEHATYYFGAVRERETQAARLTAQLAEARLGALRMQLHPHFLFNSLNAIGVLVRDQETVAAARMVELLSNVLRQVLNASHVQETTLAEELTFVRNYLAIEQVRFADRLRVTVDVEPALLSGMVPAPDSRRCSAIEGLSRSSRAPAAALVRHFDFPIVWPPQRPNGAMAELRTLIVDDEPLARRGIRQMLAGEADVVVLGECRNGREAVEALQRLNPDLVFLDVQMPDLDGFAVIREHGIERMPAVVFVTAHDEFAVHAFEAHALDYLVKPLHAARFAQTMARVRERQRVGTAMQLVSQLSALLGAGNPTAAAAHQAGPGPGRRYDTRLVVPATTGDRIVNVDTIDWVEADDYYARLHVGRVQYLLRESLSRLARRLDPAAFARVHRSAIVRIDSMREIQGSRGRTVVVLRDGTRIRVSRRRTASLRALVRRRVD